MKVPSTLFALLLCASVASAHFKWKKLKSKEKASDPWPTETTTVRDDDEPGRDGCDVIYDDVWEEKCKTVFNETKCWDSQDR